MDLLIERTVAWHQRRFPEAIAERVAMKGTSEWGELNDAILGMTSFTGSSTGKGDVGSEAADVMICLTTLLGRYFPDIDLLAEWDKKLTILETPGAHAASVT
jgi:hypothetical protein